MRSLAVALLPVALPLAALAAGVALPETARACGGTWCDTAPNSMPVDQSSENILFAFDGDNVEVHIQIAYDPDTYFEKFSWIVPVQTLPEFLVGSELLFDNVLNGTVPLYGVQNSFESCDTSGAETGGFDTDGTTTDGGTSTTGGGPEIVYQGTVGAFEVTVLKGGTVDEVIMWLDMNGYAQDPEATPILDAYLKEGNLFAAFKLLPSETPVVHPVVLRYAGVEPCVPIRLTRIAAVDDMDIRVFFLGDHRAVPTNYRHVLVNPLMIDWPNLAANYKEVVTLAVDAFKAEGNAFVTEYAGPSAVISKGGLHSAQWDSQAFVGLPATQVIDTLMSQGIMECWDFGEIQCELRHPLLQGLLDTYLPAPMGIPRFDFYFCLSCYEGMIDLGAWGDGSGFAADFAERIVDPGQRALDLLNAKPYVTRMYTTISPQEMNEDPVFAENPDLGDVQNVRIANHYLTCDGDARYTLPDGRIVWVPNDGPWPTFPDAMPWEEETQQMTLVGAPQVLNSNTALIDMLLDEWNQMNMPSTGTTGGETSGGMTSESSGAGSDSAASASASAGSDSASSDGSATTGGMDMEDSGCGCASDSRGGGWAALGLAGLLGLRRRQRRR
ncbi:MAG: DUF2330 domain-containing protein [Myxococcales bacterium]|nr:DUF2330 domain-containing protein [Myxococcales bacterium]